MDDNMINKKKLLGENEDAGTGKKVVKFDENGDVENDNPPLSQIKPLLEELAKLALESVPSVDQERRISEIEKMFKKNKYEILHQFKKEVPGWYWDKKSKLEREGDSSLNKTPLWKDHKIHAFAATLIIVVGLIAWLFVSLISNSDTESVSDENGLTKSQKQTTPGMETVHMQTVDTIKFVSGIIRMDSTSATVSLQSYNADTKEYKLHIFHLPYPRIHVFEGMEKKAVIYGRNGSTADSLVSRGYIWQEAK
ncbi:hypothetical protein A2755_02880 [Candidatus Wolfebacteria bacterium RIFCSPHIGHO2_01_FULL_48_22]|uniref:Uncharacterized protein n=2 Tax=Candidatus Wolfeibacteriota TaxID=1752735 RepID=A0A1F8DS80_9BACT|nr:MAG: hypothetical protein A2755_02880 [Candidatus Wolfebacteria bacterium RIFCSPHIGHO2_01_FULL_48_22]OGM92189.1 MAG: hypothetical protein A2935_00185 [Candidatus Wolfebacteria bacterium RIFCSPLOWO2_01_FULL_47_17b]